MYFRAFFLLLVATPLWAMDNEMAHITEFMNTKTQVNAQDVCRYFLDMSPEKIKAFEPFKSELKTLLIAKKVRPKDIHDCIANTRAWWNEELMDSETHSQVEARRREQLKAIEEILPIEKINEQK